MIFSKIRHLDRIMMICILVIFGLSSKADDDDDVKTHPISICMSSAKYLRYIKHVSIVM